MSRRAIPRHLPRAYVPRQLVRGVVAVLRALAGRGSLERAGAVLARAKKCGE